MAQNIKLLVISDNICPWCYVGWKELESAIDRAKKSTPELSFEVEFRPYLLDPSLECATPIDKATHFNEKFGPERMAMAQKMLLQRGDELGIKFKFGGKIRQTTNSHRLLLAAHQKGGNELQQKVVGLVFRNYFENEQDIGDVQVLAAIAEEAGLMNKPEALDFLASDKLAAEVKGQIREAQMKGVTGVPFTVINEKYAVSGAQKADIFYQLFDRLTKTGSLS